MIYHFTHSPIRKEIDASGFVGLEGCRLEYFIEAGLHLNQPRASELSYQWRSTKKEYKARGRYVWFTEQEFCYSIGNPEVPKVRYGFDPKEIRAFSWPSIMEMAVSDKKRFAAMKEVSEYGMSVGDDPFKWWVTFEEISLDHCQDITEVGSFPVASAPL